MEKFSDLLRKNGLKATQARLGVLKLLTNQNVPSDVREILGGLAEQQIMVDQATVYRIVEKLIEKGLVKAVNFEEGKLRYELVKVHHHHLVCVKCRRVEAYENCDVDDLVGKIKKSHGFMVEKHNLEFFGVCRNCI